MQLIRSLGSDNIHRHWHEWRRLAEAVAHGLGSRRPVHPQPQIGNNLSCHFDSTLFLLHGETPFVSARLVRIAVRVGRAIQKENVN